MERRYGFLFIGAILAAGMFAVAVQLNGASGQAGGGVVPPNATDDMRRQENTTEAGNFTISEEGLGNETTISSIPTPVNTTQLRMHIDNANSAVEENDTQAAMGHIVLALEEIEMILGGNVTGTANATDTAAMDNATMTDDMEMNSTARESDDTEPQMTP